MKLFKVGDKGMRSSLFVFVVLLSFSTTVFGEGARKGGTKPAGSTKEEGDFVIEKRGDTTIKYKKKTTYDFEGSSIDGLYNKPSGSYISNIKDVKAKSIIKIRENFDAEVQDSSRLLK